MIYEKTVNLFFILVLFFLNNNLFVIDLFANSTISNDKKKPCYSVNDMRRKIQQLHQVSDAHSQCLIQMQQQLSDNQQDIDTLRGYIQDIQHRISEIIYIQQEILKKIGHISLNDNISLSQHSYQQSLTSNNSLKTIINNHDNRKKNSNYDDTDYKIAVELVLEKKQYVQAIQAFQDFIKNYPTSRYQSNAHYWLGQLYYNQDKKHDASYHFAWVVKNYPQSSKASDALLKIGIIMQETNQKEKAKTVYQQIIKLYPNSDAAKQAQKRLVNL